MLNERSSLAGGGDSRGDLVFLQGSSESIRGCVCGVCVWGVVRGERYRTDLASPVVPWLSADEWLGRGRGGDHRDTAACCVEAPWAPGLQIPGGRLVSAQARGRHGARGTAAAW